jgi:hypothetical protein
MHSEMQVAKMDLHFHRAVDLLFMKWNTADTSKFGSYFKYEYQQRLSVLCQGRLTGYSRTKNCPEATNNVIKKKLTLRCSLGIQQLLEIAFKSKERCSTECAMDCESLKNFSTSDKPSEEYI